MLKLMLGRAGAGKTTRVLERLCRAGQERAQVLIVPEQQSHEAERALCHVGGAEVSRYAEVLSFSRLANRVLQAAGGLGEEELDPGGRLLLMYQAVKAVSPQLTVYGRPSRRPAFLQALLSTVDELKGCCVPPEVLIRAGEDSPGPEGDKLRDLGLICGTYQAMTQEIALDPRDRLTRVAEKLGSCAWAEGKDLWLDGFTDFTPQQMQVLSRLLVQASSVTVTLTCDHLEEDEGGEGIFSPARRTAAGLIRLARRAFVGCEVEHLVNEGRGKTQALRHLEQNLFGEDHPEQAAVEEEIQLFRADSLRSEVEWTAAHILRLVREEGYRFREIGVAAREYSAYRDLVESVFPRYGVPVFSSAMSDILDKPVLALVTAALESVAGGYAYDDLFRYLKTGLTDLSQEDCDLLENYALKWNIQGSRWTQAKPWSWHPRGYGFDLEEEDERLLERLERARQTVIAPLETLRKNPGKTGQGNAKALYTFLEEIDLPARLEARMGALIERGEPALAEEYRQLWEILCGGLEQCASLLGDTPMELEEFAQLFRLVLSQYDVGSIPVSLDRVTAGETTRQTGHRVKVLFLLGADDGAIPRVSAAPGLLSDEDRVLLSTYGLELNQTQRELLYREMTTVYQICARPSQRLIVSWSARGPGGEERRPCFLAERLQLLFPNLRVQREEDCRGEFRLEAPQPALEQAGRDERARLALSGLEEYKRQVERLERARSWTRGSLSRSAVDCLYGRRVPMSASRMDKYRSCHFSYFMHYGLKAEPRKPAGFTAPEYGTFVHYVLEHVLRHPKYTARRDCWDDETRSLVRRLTDESVEQYVREELGGLEGQTERFRYLFHRLLKSVRSVVDNVVEEVTCSRFKPLAFELGFGSGKDLPPVELTVDGMTISVSGFVDRVDGWVKDGRLYLRVIDYKTGRKSFDLTEVWNGLGLQMLLYLFTLEEKGQSLYGLPVEGAGVLYLPARDAVIRGSRKMDEAQWRKLMDKELTRSGLVLNRPDVIDAMEPGGELGYRFLPLKVSKTTGTISGDALVTAERLGKLSRHIQTNLEEICRELARGDISADPYWRGPDKNACRWCEYAAACQFEEGRGSDRRRWLPALDAKEFWANLEESNPG